MVAFGLLDREVVAHLAFPGGVTLVLGRGNETSKIGIEDSMPTGNYSRMHNTSSYYAFYAYYY